MTEPQEVLVKVETLELLLAIKLFLEREVLPRYRELFEAAGLGPWAESVIYGEARLLLDEREEDVTP